MNEGWKNENENAYEEVTINMLSGDLICEDDINGMVGRSREAYDFIKKIFVEGSFHFSQINHSDER